MPKIKKLSPSEAQKIAAGEVVERPANVVKELIENSIDAGASAITLYIEDGGKQLIRIVDNGVGMDHEDARLSIEHHATSKITNVSDLENLNSFGFRGEALSSISSVSRFKLITKTEVNALGIEIKVENNENTEQLVSSNTGTDITISEIFYNVPARRKFLKTKETEYRAILQLFYAFAVSYINISFKLYSDNKLIYNAPVSDLRVRIEQIFETDLTQTLVDFSAQDNRYNLKISGLLSNPDYNRYDRNQIFLFVNNRWVKNYKLINAFVKGYQGMLPTGKYPAGFIFINIDPKFVDVNIHPRKEEVQFLHPRIVESLIEQAVKSRLEQKVEQSLGIKITNVERVVPAINNFSEPIISPKVNRIQDQEFLSILNSAFVNDLKNKSEVKESEISAPISRIEETKEVNFKQISLNFISQSTDVQESHDYKLIGQALITYIIIENQDGIVMIDQHAAHERIIYDRLDGKLDSVARVKLLFPQIISLSKVDVALLLPYLDLFNLYGLVVEQISANQLVVKETPVFLKNQPIDDIIKSAIGQISKSDILEINELKRSIQEKIRAQLSCSSAIKAGDVLSISTMHEIIRDLYKTENKLTCPHGRPTIWSLSTDEIEKKFKRNYR